VGRVLPHPGPLPLGAGESFAASLGMPAIGFAHSCQGSVPITILTLLILSLTLVTGCVSKARTRIEVQKAFRAGEVKGQALAEAKRSGISFPGPVLVPIVPWTEGLTLAQAIVAAHWTAIQDPRLIIVVNSAGERLELTPYEAQTAAEMPMQPGDEIELVP